MIFDLQYDRFQPEFDTLRQVCEAGHRVIVYSHMATDEVILSSLDAGASTFLAKGEDKQHLFDAIYAGQGQHPLRRAADGQGAVQRPHRGPAGAEHPRARGAERLVPDREQGVVAKRLFIEPSTVRTHLQRGPAKYAAVGRPAPTKAALIARAVRDGI